MYLKSIAFPNSWLLRIFSRSFRSNPIIWIATGSLLQHEVFFPSLHPQVPLLPFLGLKGKLFPRMPPGSQPKYKRKGRQTMGYRAPEQEGEGNRGNSAASQAWHEEKMAQSWSRETGIQSMPHVVFSVLELYNSGCFTHPYNLSLRLKTAGQSIEKTANRPEGKGCPRGLHLESC